MGANGSAGTGVRAGTDATAGMPWIDATGGLADDGGGVLADPAFRELARQARAWTDEVTGRARRGSLLERSRYTPPDNPYRQMLAARAAVATDDVVGGAAEVTEAFALDGVKWEAEDPVVADVFNQMATALDLDDLLRVLWRERFTFSQAVVAVEWGRRTFAPRPPTPSGRSSRRRVALVCPVAVRVLDPLAVVPLADGPFAPDALAWSAVPAAVEAAEHMWDGTAPTDPGVARYVSGRVALGTADPLRADLAGLGVDPDTLLRLRGPDDRWHAAGGFVVRHTATRPHYQRFADVRLRGVFALLDLKQQLLAADRAALVGAANFILLIRKGTKEQPGQQAEIDELQEKYRVLARLPVIISDHRLNVDIVAPATDLTLVGDKYDTLDERILARTLGTLTVGAGARAEDSAAVSLAVANGLRSRRHMLKRFVERYLARAVLAHPANAGVLTEEPNLVFAPRNISLGFDAALAQLMASLRSTRDVSRETMLEFVGLDQATEALRRTVEADRYDDVFGTLAMPGQTDGGPNGAGTSPQTDGAAGGRPVGGGSPPANPAKVAGRGPSGGTSPRRTR